MASRKKLFEMLNRVKIEEEQHEISDISTNASSTVSSNVQSGAGRGRLFRSDLLDKPINVVTDNSTRSNTPSDSGNVSGASSESAGLNALEIKAKKRGDNGTPISLAVNYISISCKPDISIFEYEVSFEPNIHSNKIRRGLLAGVIKAVMPVFTFDGVSLYLPQKFPDKITNFRTSNRTDNIPVEVVITYRRQKPMKECIHFYNVLFKQVMLKLEYVQFGKKMFDPTCPKIIPHRQLSIWPGYVFACDEFDEGLMLQVDTSHRVLFDTKVSDILRRIQMSCQQHPGQNFKDLVLKSLIGTVVLTPYNNKTYTIDDVDFTQSPMNTFKVANDKETTYVDYYKRNHGVDIHDHDQPLLLSYRMRKMMAKNGHVQEEQTTVCLIPELTQMTGLTDEMRNDRSVMRDLASTTRMNPNQRIEAAQKFIEKVNQTPSAREVLDKWGLRLTDDILRVQGRQLPAEAIKFGNKIIENVKGDFGNQIGNAVLFEVVDLSEWMLIYTRQDTKYKEEFLDNVRRCAGPMGLRWKDPIQHMLKDDRTETYAVTLRKHVHPNLQMVVFICPTSRDDRYATIKKICCGERPVASQVINSKTLSNQAKNRSIVQKILMQMNCKLGGSLWTIRIPFKNVMICGSDTYHNPSKKEKSVSAFVGSLNATYTKWYSKATIQASREELSHGLAISVEKALMAYKEYNGVYPDRIVMYRDGVGDGQFALCKEFEFIQIKNACRLIDANYNPSVTFIVVQKRVNARIFAVDERRNDFENPPPGCVLDHSITRRGLFDFYLVSQQMRHGTVTPSHYVVIENECQLNPDILQQLSYKLTYQYFNWPGSIRVPAPCQYSHKLAFLVGESIKREASEELNEKLYYL